MVTSSQHRRMIREFPNLENEDFQIIEPESDIYNCIAYAAGDTGQSWSDEPEKYWPPQVARDPTVRGLQNLFKSLGFKKCHGPRMEHGYQKVALYGSKNLWTHAALQTPNGRWRSKLGRGPLIEHQTPLGLSGELYGHPYLYMRRRSRKPSSDG